MTGQLGLSSIFVIFFQLYVYDILWYFYDKVILDDVFA